VLGEPRRIRGATVQAAGDRGRVRQLLAALGYGVSERVEQTAASLGVAEKAQQLIELAVAVEENAARRHAHGARVEQFVFADRTTQMPRSTPAFLSAARFSARGNWALAKAAGRSTSQQPNAVRDKNRFMSLPSNMNTTRWWCVSWRDIRVSNVKMNSLS